MPSEWVPSPIRIVRLAIRPVHGADIVAPLASGG